MSRLSSWREHGAAVDRAPPLVLLHGFLGCSADWDELRPRLEAHRWVITFDLPWHGPNPIVPDGLGGEDGGRVGGEDPAARAGGRAPTPSFQDTVAHVAAGLRAQGVERCSVMGYSMGGRLAAGLAAWHPSLVDRLVGVGARAAPAGGEARAARDATWAQQLRAHGLEAFLAAWYAQPIFDTLRAHPTFEPMLARRMRGVPAALAGALEALSPWRQPDLVPLLERSRVPALWVAGSEDRTYVSLHRELAASSRFSTARRASGCGHAPHLEDPTGFLAAVLPFVLANDQKAATPT